MKNCFNKSKYAYNHRKNPESTGFGVLSFWAGCIIMGQNHEKGAQP